MSHSRFTRQLFFFVLAVVLPSAVLVGFGIKILSQERRLALVRAEEEQIAFAREVGRELQEQLRISQEKVYPNLSGDSNAVSRYPAEDGTIWIGDYNGTQLRVPWEKEMADESEHPLVSDTDFLSRIGSAESIAHQSSNYALAVERYRSAAASSSDPIRRGYAELGLARMLYLDGKTDAAVAIALRLLETSSSITDQFDIPLAYYAANIILDVGHGSEAVSRRLQVEIADSSWMHPSRTYMLRDLLLSIVTDETDGHPNPEVLQLQSQASRLTDETYLALRLKEDLPGLIRSNRQTPRGDWWLYSDNEWIVSVAQSGSNNDYTVLATRIASLNDYLASSAIDRDRVAGFTGEMTEEKSDRSLRPYFMDLRVQIASSEEMSLDRGRMMYIFGVALVVGLTLFGGYLLWRDVRREGRLAMLQSQFVSSVSHELRTPLTSIRLFAEAMKGEDEPVRAERLRYLNIISNESERLTRMLNNVLSSARIEEGTMNYHREPASLTDAVRAAGDAVEYSVSLNEMELKLELEDDLPLMMIDRDTIEQAVLNLLSNAIKYGGQGNVIEMKLRKEGQAAVVSVSDRGSGISIADQQKIFQRFYRVPEADNKQISGAGLGLTIVQHIVEAHDGRVEVKSEIGRGSTFLIVLPIEEST